MYFNALEVSFETISCAFTEKPDKLFWTRLKEKCFEPAGRKLEDLESREILCFHCTKLLGVSAGPDYKTLREWIRCVYVYLIDHLFKATVQSTNDPGVQTLRLESNQLALIRDPTVH